MSVLLGTQSVAVAAAGADPAASSAAEATATPGGDRAIEANLQRAVAGKHSEFAPARAELGRPSVISTLPDLGDSSSAVVSDADERALAEQAMLEIRNDPDYIADPLLTDYLNGLGLRLAQAIQSSGLGTMQAFDFFAVRDRTINAFAMPGGYVGVYTGLMAATENESELAAVLGHEIGHVLQRHYARGQDRNSKNIWMALGGLALAILAGSRNPGAAQGLAIGGQALAVDNSLSFSREAEREADRVGFQILVSGGFDPYASPAFFSRLQRANSINEAGVPSYVRTHPLTVDRIADMQARAQQYGKRPAAPPALDFAFARARARVIQTEGPIALGDLRRVLDEQAGRAKDIEARAGLGYAIAFVEQKLGNLAAAADQLARVRAMIAADASVSARQVPALDVMSAELAVASGRLDDALAQSRQMVARYPASHAVAIVHARLLLRAGHPDEAADFLRARLRHEPGQIQFWGLVAEAYAASGKRTLQHRALAEQLMLQGAWPAALEQLRIARGAGDADFYQLSEIDARIHQVENEHRESLAPRRR